MIVSCQNLDSRTADLRDTYKRMSMACAWIFMNPKFVCFFSERYQVANHHFFGVTVSFFHQPGSIDPFFFMAFDGSSRRVEDVKNPISGGLII